jgi:equilibrative nucleoside transporter 1/2/3
MLSQQQAVVVDEEVPLLAASLPRVSTDVPQDKYRIAYIVFVIQGLGMLLPWNAFISAADYFTKLYGSSFVFFISLVFNWSGAMCYLFVKVLPRFSFLQRVMFSLFLFVVVLLVIPFLEPAPLAVSKAITLAGVFIVGIAAAIMQSSITGMAALFPPDYIGGLMSGCGIAGIVAITLRIITKSSMGDSTTGLDPSVTLFFILAACVALACAASFVVLWRLPITKHNLYALKQLKFPETNEVKNENANVKTVFRKVWKEAIVVSSTLFITLALFPGVTGLLRSNRHINADWFAILITALFMLFDFVGRTLPQWFHLFSPTALLFPALSRLVFFPLLILCIHPHVISADWASLIIISVMALSNGYCTTLAMIYGPQQVSSAERELAGIVLSGCLLTGIIVGSHFALLMLYLITGSVGI